MKKLIKIVIFLIVVALLVVGGITLIKKRKANEAKTAKANEYAVFIDTMQAKTEPTKLTLPTIALVGNDSNVVVASKVAGKVLYAKKSGDVVKRGDILVKIDNTELKASLEALKHSTNSVKVALANAINVHKTTAKLLRVGGATKEQFDAEKVKIDSLKAQIASLKSKKDTTVNNLSYTVIKSPTNGTIAKSMVTVGDLAMPGKPLMKLTSNVKSYLVLRLPKKASAVIFDKKEYPMLSLNSTFNGLNEYRADIDKFIPADQRVDVDIVLFKGKALKLPFDAILNRNGKNYVLEVKDKKIVPIEVNILNSAQEGVIVSNNLDGKKLAIAKPDILLRLISGYPFIIKNAK